MMKIRAVAITGVTKRCCRCKSFKDTSEFHRTVARKDGLQAYCRDCKKIIDKEHNDRNPRRNYENRRAYALRNLRWLHEYLKTKCCEWEGCTVSDPDMLVLDHLNPHEKRGHVSTMVHGSFSLKTVQAEVAKCRVLCANHHQKHTIRQFGYKKWLLED
ncbi:MAG TPA: hypothetical protein VF659_07070 [Pyrinomonadaceae bacterium]|jgi:hypothetical protein